MDNILILDRISSGDKKCKYFISYMDDDYKIKPLCIMLAKTSAYVKSYGGITKRTYLLIEYDKSLKNHDDIWKRVTHIV